MSDGGNPYGAGMDDSERGRLLACVDEALELVEAALRKDHAAWFARYEALLQRGPEWIGPVLRLTGELAAYEMLVLAPALQTPLEQALAEARVILIQSIEEES